MIRALATEVSKLRRSLVLLTALGGPVCAAAFSLLTLITKDDAIAWSEFLKDGLAMWAFLLLPLSISAITVFMAQLEHGPRLWTHLLTLPVPRWTLFAAKAAVVVLILAAMNVLLLGLLMAIGPVMEAASSSAVFTGAAHPAGLAALLGKIAIAAIPMAALQLWAALYFRSFIPPLMLGIIGPVVALGAVAGQTGLLLPWALPALMLSEPAVAGRALMAAAIAAPVLFGLMLLHLNRREWPA